MTEPNITIRKSESLDDWYLIEKREHDGGRWIENVVDKYGGYSRFCTSARLDKATDIEGSSHEMRMIAEAIKNKNVFEAARCAVYFQEGHFLLESPRNSEYPVELSLKEAEHLAKEIERILA